MTPVRLTLGRTFRALSVRNYRLYFTGQLISVAGTWMQSIALAELVLSTFVHGNGFDVGFVTALQFLPMLLFGSWGGLIADRLEKRKLLYGTQGSAGILALALGALTLSGHVQLWELDVMAGLLGFVNMFDNPARQTFVNEMVGRELLPNAVSLNSVLMNSARVVGPAIGGAIIFLLSNPHHPDTSHGFAACFFVNAASYAAVIVALSMMRTVELHRTPTVPRAKGQVREGLRYVWSTPALRDPLLVMLVVGIFAFNFTTTLPLLAKFSFHGGAGTYSLLTAAMGTGAVIGGLIVAHRSRPSRALLSLLGIVFGTLIIVVAWAPIEPVALGALVIMGIASIAFIATANATLQLTATPAMRGRVMALFAIAFLGSTPIGGPLVGWMSDVSSPRIALLVGGLATLAATVPLAVRSIRRPVVPTVRALFGPPQGGGGPKVAVASTALSTGTPFIEGEVPNEQASA